ncbi:MAG: ribonuclease III [Propionibacterium sp.]|nr:MAG: ribonuclease III [Propionibacterium sp.]
MPKLWAVWSEADPPSGARSLNLLADKFNQLGVVVDPQLFELALTHRSYAYENGGIPTNERLEFLGDAVLQIIVTEYLYLTYPDLPEGKLAKLRAAVVSSAALAEVARELKLGKLIKLGKGEIATKGDNKTSILADALEAVIGAVFLSGGMTAAEKFVSDLTVPKVKAAAEMGARLDPKTELQELAATVNLLVSYRISESGPDHKKVFSAEALVGDQVYGRGVGTSKRAAEQQAAAEAVESFRA